MGNAEENQRRTIFNLVMNAESEFLSDEAEILRELTNSMVNHNAVGIACEKLGRGMSITVVEDVIKTDFVTIA